MYIAIGADTASNLPSGRPRTLADMYFKLLYEVNL